MTTIAQDPALLAETVAALRIYFGETLTPGTDGISAKFWQSARASHSEIVKLIARCQKNSITLRHISTASGIPGRLLIQFVDDPQGVADAFAAEIHHLERELEAVREGRATYARWRFYMEGARKTDLAEQFGVSRPTLDKWLAEYDPSRPPAW